MNGLKNLAFLVDISTHLNILNLQLQGKNKIVTNMYDSKFIHLR
jgi:hypothetical protein